MFFHIGDKVKIVNWGGITICHKDYAELIPKDQIIDTIKNFVVYDPYPELVSQEGTIEAREYDSFGEKYILSEISFDKKYHNKIYYYPGQLELIERCNNGC